MERDRSDSVTSNLARQDIGEENFNELSLCQKLKLLSKKLKHACQEEKVLPVMFVGSMVSKLYYCMFNTFWLLYLTSKIGVLYTEEESRKLYASVMIISVVIGSLIIPVMGKIVDKFNPQIVVPMVFLLRAISIFMFMFVQDPRSFFSYLTSVLMVMGTMSEIVCCDAISLRTANKEIRGVIYGV